MVRRIAASVAALTIAAAWSVALAVGPGAGVAFAYAAPPPAPPPLSLTPTSGVSSAAADGLATVGGAEGTAEGATAICAAASAGTCVVAAVAAAGIGYGVYKTIKWAWGPHHVQQAVTSNYAYTGTTAQAVGYSLSVGAAANGWQWTLKRSFTDSTCAIIGSGISVSFTQAGESGSPVHSTQNFNSTGSCTSPQTSTFTDTTHGTAAITGACAWGNLGGSITGVAGFGNTIAPCGASAQIQHQLSLDVSCLDGSGGTVSHAVSTSASFNDGVNAPPDTQAVNCGPGTYPGPAAVMMTNTGASNNVTTTTTTMPAPSLSPSNPCSVTGAGCAPQWQQKNAAGDWNTYQPAPGDSTTPDQPARCEWTNGTLDGGPLPTSDCSSITQPQAPPDGDAATNGTDDKNCIPTGIAAFNPFEWVYKPVKCVLKWAFIPTDVQLQGDFAPLENAWMDSPPGTAATAISTLFAPFLNIAGNSGSATFEGGCAGPSVDVSLPGWDGHTRNLDTQPFSMCNSVGLWVHGWVLPWATAIVYIGGLFVVVRILTKTIGYDGPFDGDASEAASA